MFSLSNFSFSYNDRLLFDHVSFTLPRSGCVALVGDNGVGKTTLLRLLAGELRPDSGSIKCTSTVAYVPQDEPLDNLSGGEITQRHIEHALYRQDTPGVLLLDEPTNNLDTTSRDWLVHTVQNFSGLVVFASHDRTFIDEVANTVLEIQSGKVSTYTGGFTEYLARKEQEENERWAAHEKAQQQTQKLQRQLNVMRDRMHAASHQKSKARKGNVDVEWAKVHKGSTDALQKRTGAKMRTLYSKLNQVEDTPAPFERKSYAAHIQNETVHRKLQFRLTDVAKSYNKQLFKNVTAEIHTGDRWHISGPNGSGKSTLLAIIKGDSAPDSGEVLRANGIKVGYISQQVSGLSLELPGTENLESVSESVAAILKAASTMDLSPEDMAKPVRLLSRGQQTKLGILKLLLAQSDAILIDEPTNHIDIRARENIEQALAGYAGTLIVVSHDTYFVSKLGITHEIHL